MHPFKATIEIIGINPYVLVPDIILIALFQAAGRDRSPIPIHGTINELPYRQTLVRYQGAWRLYINTTMLKNSPKRIGELIAITIAFDPAERTIAQHPKLIKALKANKEARKVFDSLSPHRRSEIIRYIAHLKTEASVDKNVARAIRFLLGQESFVGRDKP